MAVQLQLFGQGRTRCLDADALRAELAGFRAFGTATQCGELRVGERPVPTFTNEFWTSAQRAAHRLHEVSYRACFKPQLPRFYVDRLTQPGALVYDPFLGRGTTVIEAALAGRRVAGCDVNPLSGVLCGPRLQPPALDVLRRRLADLPFDAPAPAADAPHDLSVFYHPDTLRELLALRRYLLEQPELDPVDRWIQMVAVNRLTGHSSGFFSVYTLPPNQATSVAAQRKINEKRQQVPPRRDVKEILWRKSKQLIATLTDVDRAHLQACAPRLLCRDSGHTPELATGSVDLVVTSPPFLAVVDYAGDNWLRCWFVGVDAARVPITMARTVEAWQAAMAPVFGELARVVRPGGFVAFEVGEVARGQVRLEEAVLPVAVAAGLVPVCVQINAQAFTKTANCWGVSNNRAGTNSNRIVVLQAP
ncbi:MAG: DNA methyltransferase [Planctomycetota bacterium]